LPTARWSRPGGCYGFRLDGVAGARNLLVDAPPDWPALTVGHATPDGPGPTADVVGPERAELPLHGGWLTVDRSPPRVTFRLPAPPPPADLVHPYLAPGAALAARWAGRESFHAGAVLADGGAWVVLGDKEAGKSTTIADFALHGVGVMADDLVVLDGDAVFAGPRCVDLRETAAGHLGAGEPLGVVGVRERWRLALEPVPARAPLRGWITLAWDDEVGVDALQGAERMLALVPFRSVRLAPGDAQELMELASYPVLRLRRPRRWSALATARERLLDAIAGR
jgi:hypothetical protein